MFTLRAVSPYRNSGKKIGTRVAGLLMVTILMVACSGDVLSPWPEARPEGLSKGQAETEEVSPPAGREGEEAPSEIESLPSGTPGPGLAEPQMAVTPGSGEPSSGGRGVISSDGTIVPSSPSGTSGPGQVESGGPSEQPFADEGPVPSPALSEVEGVVEDPTGWLTYTDAAYGFSIKYPDTYVILPEPSPLPASTPPMVHRVRFQDKQRASGQFADREPAQFAIHVFELDSPIPLGDWLQSSGLVPARATVEQVHLDGAGEGWRVRLAVMMAPNEFYYFATSEYVYRLIPLGPHSPDMLASFQLSLRK